MSAVELVSTRLLQEEGVRRLAYNDATGKIVTCRPEGNLSIGVGINLEAGLDAAEIQWLLQHRLTLVQTALAVYPWYSACDEVRQSVLLDLGFNDGVNGLLHYPHMLGAVARKDWFEAKAELLDSQAARALPSRYQPLADLLFSGAA